MAAHDPVADFWSAPMEARFPRDVVALILHCSTAKLDKDAYQGRGMRFTRPGGVGRALYKKADVIAYLEGTE
jgi:hypothetical protein